MLVAHTEGLVCLLKNSLVDVILDVIFDVFYASGTLRAGGPFNGRNAERLQWKTQTEKT